MPTFYNFAVTMVAMGFMETRDINPFLAQIKSSCRNSSFAFWEYQNLHSGQKVPVKLANLERFLSSNGLNFLKESLY